MLVSRLLFAPLVFLAVAAWAQEGGLSSSKSSAKIGKDAEPVTCTEARNVLQQVQRAMEQSVFLKPGVLSKVAASEKPVTRMQVLDELDRLEREFQPNYALKPRVQYCNPAVIKFPGTERRKAIRLIKLGFLEPVAPMVVGPADTLTVGQFSEALGFFIERWCDMTHLPTTKWSPYLQHQAPIPTPPGGPGGQAPSGASRRPVSS